MQQTDERRDRPAGWRPSVSLGAVLRPWWALARMSALEGLRRPVVLLLSLTGIVATVAAPMLLMFVFGEEGQLARDSGLAAHLLFGVFVTAHAAAGALGRERRQGTLDGLLSKPVGRAGLLLAKFAGIATVVTVYSLGAIGATLAAERIAERFVETPAVTGYITDYRLGGLVLLALALACALAGWRNYRTRRAFAAGALTGSVAGVWLVLAAGGWLARGGGFQAFSPLLDLRLLPAGLLVTLALLVLGAVALTLSTRMGESAVTLGMAGVLLLGLIADYLATAPGVPVALRAFTVWCAPDLQHFWRADALLNGGRIEWSYVARAAHYAACYAGGILAIGVFLFRRGEIKG